MNTDINNFHHLKKADLHVHLNGAIPIETTRKLLDPVKETLPKGFDIENDLIVKAPVNGLQEYFKPWHALKKLPYSRECLNTMVESALICLADDNIKYVEFRNSPFNIPEINQISLEEALLWLLESIETYSSKIGIEAKLILSLSRYNLTPSKIKNLLEAIKTVRSNTILVGVDLSGDEDTSVEPEVEEFFKTAKDTFGLGVTIHAGETGNVITFGGLLMNVTQIEFHMG